MFGLILILLLIGAALAVFLWAGSLGLQGYLYSEPAPELRWRAPAAAAVLTVFLGLLCFLVYRQLGTIDPFSFSAKDAKVYDSFLAVAPGNKPVRYNRHNTGSLLSGTEYIDPITRRPWRRTDSEGRLIETIIVEEPDKKEVRFKLQRPPRGFRENEMARYVEEGGRRVMVENDMGRITTQRGWLVVLYILLNVVHFGVWFVCLWLLLRFQWPHALGLAAAFWLFMTFLIVPMVLRRVEQVAPPRAPPASTAHHGPASSMPGCAWSVAPFRALGNLATHTRPLVTSSTTVHEGKSQCTQLRHALGLVADRIVSERDATASPARGQPAQPRPH